MCIPILAPSWLLHPAHTSRKAKISRQNTDGGCLRFFMQAGDKREYRPKFFGPTRAGYQGAWGRFSGQDTDILDIMGTRPPSSLTRVLKAALDMCMHPGDRDDPNRREAAVG